MVIVRIGGGLGNQFFQYAFAKSYSIKNKCEVLIDISGFKNRRVNNELSTAAPHCYYGLKLYKTKLKLATEEQCAYIKSIAAEKDKNRTILKKFLVTHETPKAYLIQQKLAQSSPLLFDYKGNVYFQGNFANEMLFREYRHELLKDLTLDIPLDKNNLEMLSRISSTNSVSLHIRRGDFEGTKIGILPISYHINAVKYILSKEKNLHFYIFSNDIDWAIDHLKIEAPYTIVDLNPPNKGYYDLELMRSCRHNIIANSTFSWWGAWLNTNPAKIVLAPRSWEKRVPNVIPESWIRIDHPIE